MKAIIRRSCYAPKFRGGKFRRPVRLVLIEGPDEAVTEFVTGRPLCKHTLCKMGVRIVDEFRNVDSRYSGTRSAYGQALSTLQEQL